MRRLLPLMIALVLALSACGREAQNSVRLADGEAGGSAGRSMTGDPDDTSGADEEDASGAGGGASQEPAEASETPDPDGAVSFPSTAPAAPRKPAATRPAPAQTTPSSGGGSQPNQGIAVGEPNPGDPDGCPECPVSEPVDPSATPEPRPQNPSTEPRPGTDNTRAVQWESAKVHEDDVTITVTWWSGVEPCHVLDHVNVDERADRVVITVYEGSQPGYDGACTAQAVQKHTSVKLSAPLKGRAIADGAK